jgi:hypothetical protein
VKEDVLVLESVYELVILLECLWERELGHALELMLEHELVMQSARLLVDL